MKSILALVCCLAVLSAPAALASRRVVLAEHATQWNCSYCPGPNAALDVLLEKYWADLAVVRYHAWWPGTNNDPFYVANPTENADRINYYGIASYGVPAHVVDGKKGDFQVNETRITSALAVESPVDLTMNVTYDTLARTGTISWKARAESAVTVANLRLRCAITESEVDTVGGTNGETVFQQAMRDMVDDALGEAITLVNAGDSATGTKNYSIDGSWEARNCEIVVWVQTDNASGDQWRVLQAAKYCLGAKLAQLSTSVSTGAKTFYQVLPGDAVQLTVTVQNQGGDGINALCQISSTSPYVNVTNGTWNIGGIAMGDTANNSSSPFAFSIDPAAYNGHRTPIEITKSIENQLTGYTGTTVDTVWVIVGTPATIFSDDFSGGWAANWTRGGTGGVNWDTTSLQSHSPSHCITDSRAGNYSNNVNRYIQMASGVDLSPYSAILLSWWERYSTEEGYDFCVPQVSPQGMSWFYPIPSYSGVNTTWTKRTLDVTPYRGPAFIARFRFTSDGGVVDDGWYVDDVAIEAYDSTSSGAAGTPAAAPGAAVLLPCVPNPVTSRGSISFSLPSAAAASLDIYDVAGRLVRTLARGFMEAGRHSVSWDGRNNEGQEVANGVYVYRLKAGELTATGKLAIVR